MTKPSVRQRNARHVSRIWRVRPMREPSPPNASASRDWKKPWNMSGDGLQTHRPWWWRYRATGAWRLMNPRLVREGPDHTRSICLRRGHAMSRRCRAMTRRDVRVRPSVSPTRREGFHRRPQRRTRHRRAHPLRRRHSLRCLRRRRPLLLRWSRKYPRLRRRSLRRRSRKHLRLRQNRSRHLRRGRRRHLRLSPSLNRRRRPTLRGADSVPSKAAQIRC